MFARLSHILYWLIFKIPTIGLFVFKSNFLGSPKDNKSLSFFIKIGIIIKSASIPIPFNSKLLFIFEVSINPQSDNSSVVILLIGVFSLFTLNNFWNVDTLLFRPDIIYL